MNVHKVNVCTNSNLVNRTYLLSIHSGFASCRSLTVCEMGHVNTRLTVRTTSIGMFPLSFPCQLSASSPLLHTLPTLPLTRTNCKINNKKFYRTKAFGSYDEWFGSTS